jgi:hypothetical protein
MSNLNDGEQGQVKETKKCLYCQSLMSESNMPGAPPDTKGFVCSECGFVSFFVGTHMGHYYGITMAKDRKGLSFYRESGKP